MSDFLKSIDELYENISNYASKNDLPNTLASLSLVKASFADIMDQDLTIGYFKHCLSVSWILIELQLELPAEDLDIMLSSAICHVLPEILGKEAFDNLDMGHIDTRVKNTVDIITRSGQMSLSEESAFYETIKEHPLAFMIRLADRSNLVEYLYGISPLEAKNYILETKRQFFPMCIFGKENYPQFYGPICVLMEKIRTILQIIEVIFSKYEAEESSLNEEILSLKEENSRIKAAMANL